MSRQKQFLMLLAALSVCAAFSLGFWRWGIRRNKGTSQEHVLAIPGLPESNGDGKEDPLPEGAVVRFGTARFRIPSLVSYTAPRLSPDSKRFLVQGVSGIHLIDAATGKEFHRFVNSECFAFSPDGLLLALKPT